TVLRIQGEAHDLLRLLDRDFLYLHAARGAGDALHRAGRPVHREADVELRLDVHCFCHQHPLDLDALDLHADDVPCPGHCLFGVIGHLHAAGLAAAAHEDLGLHHHWAPYPGGDLSSLVRMGGHFPFRHKDAVLTEKTLCLELVQLHTRASLLLVITRLSVL